MDMALQQRFVSLWRKYFNNAPLPITFYYTDDPSRGTPANKDTPRCVIEALGSVREGNSLSFDVKTVGCPGGRRYMGFAESIRPGFEYFLSYGIPGKMTGERYVKTPEMVKEIMEHQPPFKAPANHIVFKRWDKLERADEPIAAVFYATPDVLSGLFTLARFDETRPDPISAPFGSGCSTIVQQPYLEKDRDHPRAFVGMFDPSARSYVPEDTVSFSVPFNKLVRMIDNMEESFLITDTWKRVQARIP